MSFQAPTSTYARRAVQAQSKQASRPSKQGEAPVNAPRLNDDCYMVAHRRASQSSGCWTDVAACASLGNCVFRLTSLLACLSGACAPACAMSCEHQHDGLVLSRISRWHLEHTQVTTPPRPWGGAAWAASRQYVESATKVEVGGVTSSLELYLKYLEAHTPRPSAFTNPVKRVTSDLNEYRNKPVD